MQNPRRYVAALALCLVPAILTSQGTAAAPRVTWWPRLPLQGSLVRVVVGAPAGGGVTAVSGELAGEPLHFERFADGFEMQRDRKSTRLNSSHVRISYAVFC